MRIYVFILCFALLPSLTAPHAEEGNGMPWIDAHVHTSAQYYGALLSLVGSFGITRFVNLSGGTGDGLLRSLQVSAPFEPQIAVCLNIDWQQIDAPDFGAKQEAAMTKAFAWGARCVKISKALGLYVKYKTQSNNQALLPIDHPRLNPIWSTAGKLGLPIYIHTADPKAFFEPAVPENERYDELSLHPNWSFHGDQFPSREALLKARNRVFARFPNTQFIAVHFANNPEDIDSVDRLLDEYPNVVVDIAARLPELGRHPPKRVKAIFEKHQKRILFGTDLGFNPRNIMLGSVGRERPEVFDIFEFYALHEQWLETTIKQMKHPTPIQGRWLIDAIGLSRAALENIYWKNAIRVIWKEKPAKHMELQRLNGVPDMSQYLPF